jgi:uncharacterized protein (TIGR00251 family)
VSGYFRIRKDGIDLFVRLTPKAHRDVVESVETIADGKSYLKARVRAVPEKGKANKALEALIAKSFGFPKSAVKISAGSTSRLKTVFIAGDPDAIKIALRARFGD